MTTQWKDCPSCGGKGCVLCHKTGALLAYKGRPPRFVHRTVRNGQVRIFGATFHPTTRHLTYNGQFDGWKLVFGLYPSLRNDNTTYLLPFVYLWGSERAWNTPIDDEASAGAYHDCAIEMDGNLVYPFDFWEADPPCKSQTR